MKILISGASGLVGEALAREFRKDGHTVGRFVRPGAEAVAGDVKWDPTRARADVGSMEGADVVVNLNGAGVGDGRWTDGRKVVLRSSRIDSTRVLVDAIFKMRRKPAVFISASATGYYGNRGDEVLTESSEGGFDFLALLARDWEAEAMRAAAAGIRTAVARFGVILSAEGGALPSMLPLFKLGVGGRLGSGRQWMSWIALEDVVEIVRTTIANERLAGPLNVVAPRPVQNSEFTRVLASVLHRPAVLPAPAFALRLALGEMAGSLLLASQRALPERLGAAGYAFRFADLEDALRSILNRAQ